MSQSATLRNIVVIQSKKLDKLLSQLTDRLSHSIPSLTPEQKIDLHGKISTHLNSKLNKLKEK